MYIFIKNIKKIYIYIIKPINYSLEHAMGDASRQLKI